MKIIIGLILIGIGGYVAWEAHSILNSPLFQFATFLGNNSPISSNELSSFNSFLPDFLFNIGADTFGEMQRYLALSRIGGIVIAILGLTITFKH